MRLALLTVAALSLAACATTSPDKGSRSRLLYIAAQKAPCSNGAMKTECFQYREEPRQAWQLSYVPIDDFDYKPGNEYLLRITEVHAKDNVPADAPTVRWHVEKVVEQHAVP